jgi:type IV pilus assembly protein PilB
MRTQRSRLGEILVGSGFLSESDLETALETAAMTNTRLESLVARMGTATEYDVASAVSERTGYVLADFTTTEPDQELLDLIPRWLAERHYVVPLWRHDGTVCVAMSDPTDLVAIDDIQAVSGAGNVRRCVATPTAVMDAIDRLYPVSMDALARLDSEGTVDIPMDVEDASPTALHESAQAAPIVHLVGSLIADAIRHRATDIHIEPQELTTTVRFRIDGLLRETTTLPRRFHALVVSRLKIVSGMDIAERRRPQDGRSKVHIEGREIDMRVSSIPTMMGEKIVIRLLEASHDAIEFSSLGLSTEESVVLSRHLTAPQGLIVFTGPTGAGKTSTMYAALKRLRSPEKNTITLEDPIEYHLPGLNQVQINDKSGVTFARGLRSMLRQDPDIIMVGEVRDLETAEIVMQAALTGHLVLTSLHTNDAASAVTRLIDLGVEHFLIASALSLVVAQRLVRVVCPHCAEPAQASQDTLDALELSSSSVAAWNLQRGRGCEICGFSGFLGRTGVYEILPINRAIRDLIGPRTSESDIVREARAEGRPSLRRSGLDKAREGITTLEEILRVTFMDLDEILSCPSCGHQVQDSFIACPYCESDLPQHACRSCGNEVLPGWAICPFCRAALDVRNHERRRPALLLIDRDSTHRGLAEELFADTHDLLFAESGMDGVDRAIRERPALIVLDSPLPDLTLVEVIERLRSSPATRLTPIVALTGPDDGGDGARSLGVQMLSKPVDLEVLKGSVALSALAPAARRKRHP